MEQKYRQLMLFPVYKIRETGEEFSTIHNAAFKVKNLTLNSSYSITRGLGLHQSNFENIENDAERIRASIFSRSTIFKEIDSVLFNQNNLIKELLVSKPNYKEININVLAEMYIERIKTFISRYWKECKHHIMIHSGGYDSRIISKILFDYKGEIGNKEFGTIKLVCFKPELDSMEIVAKKIGWKNEDLILVGNTEKDLDYYRFLFKDLCILGKLLNEGNRTLYTVVNTEEIKKLNYKQEDTFYIAGLYADELLSHNIRKYKDLSFFAASHFADFSYECVGVSKFMFPNLSYDILKLFSDFHIQRNKTEPKKNMLSDEFKLVVLQKLDEDLVNIPNPRFSLSKLYKTVGYSEDQIISEETRSIIDNNIKKSWYYKNFKEEVDKFLPIPNWVHWQKGIFSLYGKISICEYLLSLGCSINV